MLIVDVSSFTDNAGLCGIPGLRTCGPHLSVGAKIGIALGGCVALLLLVICSICWCKRRENILRAQRISAGKDIHRKLVQNLPCSIVMVLQLELMENNPRIIMF